MTPPPEIHIVGRGAVSSLGLGVRRNMDAIFAGESGVRPLDRLAGTDCLTAVAAEVPRELYPSIEPAEDLARHFSVLAARQALNEWGGTPDEDFLFVSASTKADLSGITTDDGQGLGNPWRLAAAVQAELELPGRAVAVSCACASGLSALALAARELRAGHATRALVVGADCLTPFILRGFSSLLALDPKRCRPFDRTRKGLNVGEGGGAIVLSTAERGTATLAGWGESNDANHVTGPSRDGSGLALAIERALRQANQEPGDIDYAHLHATGTPFNDAMEGKALARVFGTAPVASGSKAQLGHTLGAAGLLESLIAIEALERAVSPPNLGLQDLDEDCGIELPPGCVELPDPEFALKSAAGFGGINVSLVFRKVTR